MKKVILIKIEENNPFATVILTTAWYLSPSLSKGITVTDLNYDLIQNDRGIIQSESTCRPVVACWPVLSARMRMTHFGIT